MVMISELSLYGVVVVWRPRMMLVLMLASFPRESKQGSALDGRRERGRQHFAELNQN